MPSVTQILDAELQTYSRVPPAILEKARAEGSAIHKAVELHLAGNVGHMPTWLSPYLDAFAAFVMDTGFILEASEKRMWHRHFLYGGTADLFGWLEMRRVGVQHVCIDLKRSFMAGAAIGLQTAAYSAMFNEEKPKDRIQARFALRFRPGHSPPYELKPFAERSDFGDFLNLLGAYRYKVKHGHYLDNGKA